MCSDEMARFSLKHISVMTMLALISLGLLRVGANALGDELSISASSRAGMAIISGSDTAPAQRLGHYLRLITGAAFELKKHQADGDRPRKSIFVGQIKEFPWLSLDQPKKLGDEGFAIKTTGDSLYIVAAHPKGVEHAVSHFLRLLGCRWFFPGKTWEIVPRHNTITGTWNVRSVPAFKTQRRIWYGYGAYKEGKAAWESWNRNNQMGSSIDISIGHTWHGLDPKKHFDAHPQWFALVEGKRQATKPCYTHPKVLELAIASALKQAARGKKMISMTPPDGLGYCECERCRVVFQKGKPFEEKGTWFARRPDGMLVNITSETVFSFVNQVAKAVAAKHADTMIGCYAYSAYSHPPSFDLHPNVYLQTTTAYRRTPIALDKQLEAFGRRTRQLGIREYYSVYQWDWDYPDPGKMKLGQLQKDLRFFHKHGVTAVNAEASNNWAPRGLGYYVASQLMWDVDADVKKLVRDFYEKAFGPAARTMERYYVRWYGLTAAVFGDGANLPKSQAYFKKGKHDLSVLNAAFRDLDQAATQVRRQPQYRDRIDHLRMYLHYLLLRYELEQANQRGDQSGVLTAIKNETEFGGRLTDTHMIHTRPLLGKAFLRRFRKFESIFKDVDGEQRHGQGYRRIGKVPDYQEVQRIWDLDKQRLSIN